MTISVDWNKPIDKYTKKELIEIIQRFDRQIEDLHTTLADANLKIFKLSVETQPKSVIHRLFGW
jgi:hypothetical protein